VEQGDEMVEGYDLLVGGGAGAHQALGRPVRKAVPFPELPPIVLALLSAWMNYRDGDEDFQAWTARQNDEVLARTTEELPLLLREGVRGRGPSQPNAPLFLVAPELP
jgi:sulfite reductase beta subunit-like hemoprotein